MGIEPTCAAWEAAVLPLNYIREGGVVQHKRGLSASVFYVSIVYSRSAF
jgi:hypothetical protein